MTSHKGSHPEATAESCTRKHLVCRDCMQKGGTFVVQGPRKPVKIQEELVEENGKFTLRVRRGAFQATGG
jgi:hypothetical protein